MRRCYIHGIDYDSDCPRCVADQRHREALQQAERIHEESIEASIELARATAEIAEREAYKKANPGDYECPRCKYITLRRDADRCPLCQGTIGADYWPEALAREERERQAEIARAEKARSDSFTRSLQQKHDEYKRRSKELDEHQWWFRVLIAAMAVAIAGLVFGYSPLGHHAPSWWLPILWLALGVVFHRLGRNLEEWLEMGYVPTYIGFWLSVVCVGVALVTWLFL